MSATIRLITIDENRKLKDSSQNWLNRVLEFDRFLCPESSECRE